MKTTQQPPQHCAHVADYHAEMIERLSRGAGSYLRAWFTDVHHIKIGGAEQLVEAIECAVIHAKRASSEWVRAGGAA